MTDILLKRSAESVFFDIDCSPMLSRGETITSVLAVAVDEATTPALTLSSATVNTAAIKYKTGLAPAGTVIQVLISGGAIPNGVDSAFYTLRFDFSTPINPRVQAVVTLQLTDAA